MQVDRCNDIEYLILSCPLFPLSSRLVSAVKYDVLVGQFSLSPTTPNINAQIRPKRGLKPRATTQQHLDLPLKTLSPTPYLHNCTKHRPLSFTLSLYTTTPPS
jgi:hypothetical protein